MRPDLSARESRGPNARSSSKNEPIDWLAEFDSETEADPEPEREFEDTRYRSYADTDLAMFPPEASQPENRQEPLFHVRPAGPPTGPQPRYGDYLDNPPPDSLDTVLAGVDRAVNRLPQYSIAMVAQLRRRRAVFAAMAAILVISTAATAGSLAMRRWQRSPEKAADQRSVAAPSASAAAVGGPFGASTVAPVPPAVTNPTPRLTHSGPPKPSPKVAPAAPLPKPTPKAATKPDRIATVTSNSPPAAGNRPVTLGASPAATPTPSPTLTPTPTGTPVRTPVATSTPASTPTPRPTPTAAPVPTPTPAMSPEAVDTAAIHGVIDRYRRTFDSLSVDDVAAFWPSVNVRSLSRAFDQLASQHLTFEGCSISLRGHQADATCRGRVQFVPKVGSRTPRVENRQWTFLLLRSDTAWTITRVDVR